MHDHINKHRRYKAVLVRANYRCIDTQSEIDNLVGLPKQCDTFREQ